MEITSLTSLGQELVLATLAEFSSQIFDIILQLASSSSEHAKLKNLLNRIDIQAKLSTIDALVSRIDSLHVATPDMSVLNICLEHVEDSVSSIHILLKEIDVAVVNHSRKMLPSYRCINYTSLLSKLDDESTVLDRRLDLLLKVLTIPTGRLYHRKGPKPKLWPLQRRKKQLHAKSLCSFHEHHYGTKNTAAAVSS